MAQISEAIGSGLIWWSTICLHKCWSERWII